MVWVALVLVVAAVGWVLVGRKTAMPPAFSLAVAVPGLLLLVLVGGVLGWDGVTRIDAPTMNWTVAQRTDGLTPAVRTVTDLGGTPAMTIVAVVACAWLAWRRRWAEVVVTTAVSLGAGLTVFVVKALVGRRRPPVDHLVTETSHSFPSGHTLGSTAVLGVVAAVTMLSLRRRAARVAVGTTVALFVLAVGVSRVYLGVHWPTDVLAGWSFGALWIVAGTVALRRLGAARHRAAAATAEAEFGTTARR
ncbi:phosphatase PAP2 family protein [Nocardia blacklockiae]|uniref:phosphatase PAP2 family protein n=1 Tax=Nocardia blacklockiae TaxID=480036 RepID=UPI001892FC54|nr:phosphatase PAP2 family protein [Nocardia blacklockiae]MBF6174575.1 phosphatase PAP2 family protein [Nocardia blacklockiae]